MTPPERPEVAAIWREWEAWIDSLNTVPVEYAPAHTAPFVSRESVRPVAMDFIRRAFEAGAAAAEPLRGALDEALSWLEQGEHSEAERILRAALEATAPSTPLPALDVERLARAMRPVTRNLIISGGDKGHDKWLSRTAEAIAAEYAALTSEPRAAAPQEAADG